MRIKQLEKMTRKCCQQTTDDCFQWLETEHGFAIVYDGERRFAVRLGSVPVAGVCHLDTVLNCTQYQYIRKTQTVVCSELDDRLGLACLLLLAETHDITIVCCDDEEVGCTTGDIAADYLVNCGQPINWIFELDRRGTDVVTYDYSSPTWDALLGGWFGTLGIGSFSDISQMDSIGVKGFNLAIGYYREHNPDCYARLNETLAQYRNMNEFIETFAHTRFPHDGRQQRYDDWGFPMDRPVFLKECESCGTWQEDYDMCDTEFGLLCDECNELTYLPR